MIDIKRKKLELSRVTLAQQELEFKIEERLEEIKRLESMIEIQKQKRDELSKEIEELEKGAEG